MEFVETTSKRSRRQIHGRIIGGLYKIIHKSAKGSLPTKHGLRDTIALLPWRTFDHCVYLYEWFASIRASDDSRNIQVEQSHNQYIKVEQSHIHNIEELEEQLEEQLENYQESSWQIRKSIEDWLLLVLILCSYANLDV